MGGKKLFLKKEESDFLLERYDEVNKRLRTEIEARRRACSMCGYDYKPREFMTAVLEYLVSIGLLCNRRAYIVQSLVNGVTTKEVCEDLGLSVSMVQQEWVKAIKAIKEIDYEKARKDKDDLVERVNTLEERNKFLEAKVSEMERQQELKEEEKRWIDEESKDRARFGDIKIKDLRMSSRLRDALKCFDIETYYDLRRLPLEKVKRCRNVGKKTIAEFLEILEMLG